MRRLHLAALLVVFSLLGITPVRAQTPAPGTICISTFADANRNSIQEQGEASLGGVSANLKQDGILLSNLVTSESSGELCFRNLPAGEYAVVFASQFADATTATQFAFSLKPNDRLQAQFGAAPQAVAPVPSGLVIPLTRPVRLGMAISGALMMMVFMTGLGMVLRNLFALTRGGSNQPNVPVASRG